MATTASNSPSITALSTESMPATTSIANQPEESTIETFDDTMSSTESSDTTLQQECSTTIE